MQEISSFSFHSARRACSVGALLAIAALLSTQQAQAQTTNMPGLKLSSDQPIQIESDKLEVHDQQSNAVFTGKVKVVQGTTTLQAGKMTVFYKRKSAPSGATNASAPAKPQQDAAKAASANGSNPLTGGNADIDHIVVDDHVLLTSGTQTATADSGSFDMAQQLAVLKGQKVVLTDGPNVFTGCQLTVHMQTGEAQLDSCGGRVQVQLDPKSQQNKK